MTYIVAEPCIKCKYTDCVSVCPVDAFREGANCLVIDPDICIDCDLCVPECPVDAIFSEDDLPETSTSNSTIALPSIGRRSHSRRIRCRRRTSSRMSKPNAICLRRALEATERWALDVWKRGEHDWILQSAPG